MRAPGVPDAAGQRGQGAGFASRGFFARDTVTVARDLIGAELVAGGGAVVARIVEVEAYLGERDAASHAGRGPTPRSRIMFEAPGHLYVYFSYGMHHCANIVTEKAGVAGAVLLRAASVVSGEDVVRERRRNGHALAARRLLSGPGNVCQGLGLGLDDNGMDLCAPDSRLRIRRATTAVRIGVTTRIGITRNADAPLRFVAEGDPALSR